jgi:hypothetical protein
VPVTPTVGLGSVRAINDILTIDIVREERRCSSCSWRAAWTGHFLQYVGHCQQVLNINTSLAQTSSSALAKAKALPVASASRPHAHVPDAWDDDDEGEEVEVEQQQQTVEGKNVKGSEAGLDRSVDESEGVYVNLSLQSSSPTHMLGYLWHSSSPAHVRLSDYYRNLDKQPAPATPAPSIYVDPQSSRYRAFAPSHSIPTHHTHPQTPQLVSGIHCTARPVCLARHSHLTSGKRW